MTTAAYALEKELASDLSALAALALYGDDLSSHLHQFAEVPVESVVADLVLVRPWTPCCSSAGADASNASNDVRARLSFAESALLSELLSGAVLSVEELGLSIGADVNYVTAQLKRLIRLGLVISEDERFRAGPATAWLCGDIVAVEAKLSRWRDALEQASEYVSFANESYVALPEALAQKTQVMSACAARGVGVLAVSPDMGVRVVVAACRQQHRSAAWIWTLSKTCGLRTSPSGKRRLETLAAE